MTPRKVSPNHESLSRVAARFWKACPALPRLPWLHFRLALLPQRPCRRNVDRPMRSALSSRSTRWMPALESKLLFIFPMALSERAAQFANKMCKLWYSHLCYQLWSPPTHTITSHHPTTTLPDESIGITPSTSFLCNEIHAPAFGKAIDYQRLSLVRLRVHARLAG